MMHIRQKMSQLLIVDIQDKVFAPIPDSHEIIEKTVRLIKAATHFGVPITVSEHYPKGIGSTVELIRRALGHGAATIEKLHFSCLKNETLRLHFEEHRDIGRGQMVIAGIETHVCVLQTGLDLIADGYEVFLVADATGSRSPMSRELAMRRLRQAGAVIVDSEMVIFEWLEKAGTADFKALLPLIK